MYIAAYHITFAPVDAEKPHKGLKNSTENESEATIFCFHLEKAPAEDRQRVQGSNKGGYSRDRGESGDQHGRRRANRTEIVNIVDI